MKAHKETEPVSFSKPAYNQVLSILLAVHSLRKDNKMYRYVLARLSVFIFCSAVPMEAPVNATDRLWFQQGWGK